MSPSVLHLHDKPNPPLPLLPCIAVRSSGNLLTGTGTADEQQRPKQKARFDRFLLHCHQFLASLPPTAVRAPAALWSKQLLHRHTAGAGGRRGKVLLLPLPRLRPVTEIHPARRRRKKRRRSLLVLASRRCDPDLDAAAAQLVYSSRGGVGFLTRFGGGFATGIGGQFGLPDLYRQLLVLSFPLGWEAFTCHGCRFGSFLTDWLSAVCGVVVLLLLSSHFVVIGGGRRKS